MGWFNFTFFTISNGVRQEGILSPKIFALYMNYLMAILVAILMINVSIILCMQMIFAL